MSGALQAIFQNQRSFGLSIGDAFGGGFFAGQISTVGNSIADYNLVVGPLSTAQSYLRFDSTPSSNLGALSNIDGPANSLSMNNADHPAAQFCEGLTIGGFSDWYLPAKNELEVCYYNLKPSTDVNDTASGINANAVPARASNYTAGTPAQTSATIFRQGQAQSFSQTAYYWSSTALSSPATYACFQFFDSGVQYTGGVYNNRYVRAIRRVAV